MTFLEVEYRKNGAS